MISELGKAQKVNHERITKSRGIPGKEVIEGGTIDECVNREGTHGLRTASKSRDFQSGSGHILGVRAFSGILRKEGRPKEWSVITGVFDFQCAGRTSPGLKCLPVSLQTAG